MKNYILYIAMVMTSSLYSHDSTADSVVSEEHDIKVSNKKGFEVNSGDFYFRANGVLMVDFGMWDGIAFSGVNSEGGSAGEIRRAKLYLNGKYKDWQFRFHSDFAGDREFNRRFYIKYSGFKDIDIYIGRQSKPFGLENLNSAKYISPMERSASVANFSGDRALGLSIAGSGNDYSYHIGGYEIASNATDNNYSLTGRATYVPINSDQKVLHLGASFNLRQLDESLDFDVKNRAGVHSTKVKSIISDGFIAKGNAVYNLELSYTYNQWNIVGEYVLSDFHGISAADDRKFSNYYIQTGFFLTNDQRSYSVASGTFGGIKPSSENGAVEIFTHFEHIDLSDQNFGSDAEILTLGVNWFSSQVTRFSLNYVTTNIDYARFTDNGTTIEGSAISMRVQFDW